MNDTPRPIALLAIVGAFSLLVVFGKWGRQHISWEPNYDGTTFIPNVGDVIITGTYRNPFSFSGRRFDLRIFNNEWQVKWQNEPNSKWRYAGEDFLLPKNY